LVISHKDRRGTGDSTEEEEVFSDNKAAKEKKAKDSEDSGLA
jgi:hypothetical protein